MDVRKAVIPVVIVIAVLLAANAVFFFVKTRPEVDRYRQLVDDSGPQAEKVQDQEQAVKRLEKFVDKLEQAQVDMATLKDDVLSTASRRQVEVMAELDDLCRQFNIPIEEVDLDHEILLDEGLKRISMITPLEGGYGSLRRFLQAIERSDKFLVVEEISLQEGGPQAQGLELDIGLSSYFQATDEEIQRETSADPSARRRRRGA